MDTQSIRRLEAQLPQFEPLCCLHSEQIVSCWVLAVSLPELPKVQKVKSARKYLGGHDASGSPPQMQEGSICIWFQELDQLHVRIIT